VRRVGDKLNAEGSKSAICVDQQQGAVQLEERCGRHQEDLQWAPLYVLYVNATTWRAPRLRITASLQQRPGRRLCS